MLPALHTIPLSGLNHLLKGEDWARAHLKSFAGQTARLEMPPLRLAIAITPEGFFRHADNDNDLEPTVRISLPADTPLRTLSGFADRSSLLASAQIQGSADLADCLGFVFRNLNWDVESDLAPWFGDIAAHRLVHCGRQFAGWQRKLGWNLARNLADFLTEENPTITKHQDVAEFGRQVTELGPWMISVEQRIASLENKGNSGNSTGFPASA